MFYVQQQVLLFVFMATVGEKEMKINKQTKNSFVRMEYLHYFLGVFALCMYCRQISNFGLEQFRSGQVKIGKCLFLHLI